MPPIPALEALAARVEKADALDGIAARTQALVRRALPPAAESVLQGEPLGHPLHPALVVLPIGAWSSATILDLLGEGSAARKLTGLGCLAALPTAAAGSADWVMTTGPQRRTGFVHALVNDAALTVYLLSWRSRRRGRHWSGFLLSLVGGGLLSAGGWLGGHLAYREGVGVNTEEFRQRNSAADQPQAPGGMVVVEPTEA